MMKENCQNHCLMNKWLGNIALALIVGLLTFSCSAPKETVNNYAYIYQKNEQSLFPDYVVYHSSKDSTTIYFKIESSQLLFTKKVDDSLFHSDLVFQYKLFNDFEKKTITDSNTVVLHATGKNGQNKHLYGAIKIKAPFGNNYVFSAKVTEPLRGNIGTTLIEINKKDEQNRQNFLLLNENNLVSFKTSFDIGEKVIVKCKQPLEAINCRFYSRDYPLPLPPFVTDNLFTDTYDADDVFTIEAMELGTFEVEIKTRGFYHLLTDTTQKTGVTLFSFDKNFPEVTSVNQMIECVRYLTSKNEFKSIEGSKTPKETLERFWLSLGGSTDRAKLLIKEYYNRVEQANRHFTSYTEGWKTDRGLIYIVYGPPNTIYKNNMVETWVYGEEGNIMTISMQFQKVKNPFTENDFVLDRNPLLKSSWYRSIDSWRQGKVY